MTKNNKNRIIARDYKTSTLKRLFTLSGNECAWPDCKRTVIAKDGKTISGKICHIEAASEEGARYNINMLDNDRRHFDNLIIMCDECHVIIDNPENEKEYTVELLKSWKKSHEGRQLNKISTNPSILSQAINAISEASFDYTPEQNSNNYFSIDEKIKYNSIKRNKSLIDEYMVFQHKINVIYKELEEQGSFKKEKLLKNIRNIYLKIKGVYVGNSNEPMKIISTNADNIIDDVENALYEIIKNQDTTFVSDDASFAISVIMVDAFMRCKILEEPVSL